MMCCGQVLVRLEWSGRGRVAVPDGRGSYSLLSTPVDRACGLVVDKSVDSGLPGARGRAICADAFDALPTLDDESIDMICIDPPYNTGRDFGDYHDGLAREVWTTLMHDRFVDAHRLLAETGSIWVHLDQSESPVARLLLDEVFGKQNFVGEIAWEKTRSRSNVTKRLATVTDPILVYRKTSRFHLNGLPRPADDEKFSTPDGDGSPWRGQPPTAPSTQGSESMVYGIEQPLTGQILYPPPGRHWSLSREQMKSILSGWAEYVDTDLDDADHRASLCAGVVRHVPGLVLADAEAGRAQAWAVYRSGPWPQLYFTKSGRGLMRRKAHLSEIAATMPATTLISVDDLGVTTTGAKHELRALFPGARVFSTPKPERLLARMISIATDPGDVVLDFFAGSGTTAAVAHKLGRDWIGVEVSQATVDQWFVPRLSGVVFGTESGAATALSGDSGGSFTIERAEP